MEISKDSDCQYMLGLLYIKGEGVQKNHSLGMMMVRNAAKDGNADAQNYLKRITSIERPLGQADPDDMPFEDLNTPDLIGGVKGVEPSRSIFSIFKKKNYV